MAKEKHEDFGELSSVSSAAGLLAEPERDLLNFHGLVSRKRTFSNTTFLEFLSILYNKMTYAFPAIFQLFQAQSIKHLAHLLKWDLSQVFTTS